MLEGQGGGGRMEASQMLRALTVDSTRFALTSAFSPLAAHTLLLQTSVFSLGHGDSKVGSVDGCKEEVISIKHLTYTLTKRRHCTVISAVRNASNSSDPC